jgi:hypothetical protein
MANLQRLLRLGLSLAFNPARIVEDAASAARRTAVMVACALAAGLILLPALGCAAAGLWIYVQNARGPVWAALATAAAFLVVSVIVLLIGLIASRKPSRHRARAESAPQMGAAAAIPAALAALAVPKAAAAAGRGFFNRHKGTALLTAAVVGLVMGQDLLRPRFRRKQPR